MLLQRLGRAQRRARTARGHLHSRQLLPSPSGRKLGLSKGFVLPLHSPGAQKDPGSCQQPVPSPIPVKLRPGGASSYQLCPDFNSKGRRLVPSVWLAKGRSVCLSVCLSPQGCLDHSEEVGRTLHLSPGGDQLLPAAPLPAHRSTLTPGTPDPACCLCCQNVGLLEDASCVFQNAAVIQHPASLPQ